MMVSGSEGCTTVAVDVRTVRWSPGPVARVACGCRRPKLSRAASAEWLCGGSVGGTGLCAVDAMRCAADGCAWWYAVVVVAVVVVVLVLVMAVVMGGHAMVVECEGRARTGGEGNSSRRAEARLLRSGTRDEGSSPALAIKRRPRHWIIPARAPRVLCGAEQDEMGATRSAPPGPWFNHASRQRSARARRLCALASDGTRRVRELMPRQASRATEMRCAGMPHPCSRARQACKLPGDVPKLISHLAAR